MFVQSMKMRGTISLNLDRSMTFRSKLYDGTPFELTVSKHDVQLNESFLPSKMTVSGFLYVVKESQQADRCYLTLPKPTIQFGRQITVSEFDLMPPGLTVDDFIAKPNKKVSVSPDIKPEELEAKVMGTPMKKPEPGQKVKKKSAAKKSTKARTKTAN